MKELSFGVVLILVLGIGSFMYRNVMERPYASMSTPGACTMEARTCPDGTAVGRTGPGCNFAACALPNVEIPSSGLAFAIPSGYTRPDFAHPDLPLVMLEKPSASASVRHQISINLYEIPAGQTADQVILSNTRFQPADMAAEDFSRFKTEVIGGRSYRVVVIERFEAMVQSSYFLVREKDVLRFDVVEHDVVNWTDASLVIDDLPEHQALRKMLETLQVQ
jgi:hypothetical protein